MVMTMPVMMKEMTVPLLWRMVVTCQKVKKTAREAAASVLV
jgi:hypothetical protein